jgi:hypothetical protein
VAQAGRLIHDNDVERLKQLLAEYPGLLSWQSHDWGSTGDLLEFATSSYGDSFDPISEEHVTRAACAELLIDAGAVVRPSVCEGLLKSRAKGLLELFRRKGLLPGTLKFHAALGDIDAVRTALDGNGNDLPAVTEAFAIACGFEHEAVASLLLERCSALDPELGAHLDGSVGRHAFVGYFIENRPRHATAVGLWKGFVTEQVSRAVSSWSGHSTSVTPSIEDGNLTAFVRLFQRESWLLDEAFAEFQADIIATATLKDRWEFIMVLLDLDAAISTPRGAPTSRRASCTSSSFMGPRKPCDSSSTAAST